MMGTLKPAILLLKPKFRPGAVVWSGLSPTLLSKDAMARLGAECGVNVGYNFLGTWSDGVWVKYTGGVWQKITSTLPLALTAGYR